MKKFFFLLLILGFVFVACQKEYDPGPLDNTGTGTDSTGTDTTGTGGTDTTGNGTDSNQTATTLAGTWNFISLTEQTQVTSEGNVNGESQKTISTFACTSTNNKGTIFFTDATANSQNISYTIAGNLKALTYLSDSLLDSTATLFSYNLPASSGNGNYKLIGKDSIYFTGTVFSAAGTSGVNSSISGGHYALNGNTLKITSLIDTTFSQEISGVVFNQRDQADVTITLQKQ